MNRRTFLRGAGVGLIAAGGGWLLARGRVTRWRIARALEARLAPFAFGAGVLEAFLADVSAHDAPLLERAGESAMLDLLAGRLLLSTDAFTRTSEEGPLSYRVYANVYVNACTNPFARFVETAREMRPPEEIYRAHCASCHETDGPSLADAASRLGDEVEAVVRHGRGRMPSARALGLDEREENAIVRWLREGQTPSPELERGLPTPRGD